jgi:DNA polymerase zeta
VDFYGFHVGYKPFLKILVADPTSVSRMVSILQSGSVMGVRFRVFESHLSYTLQFLCDFNLYGCGLIDIEDALERAPEAHAESGSLSEPRQAKFDASPYFRESRLPLEVDTIAPQILNRHHLAARNLHHRLNTSIPDLPSEPLVHGVRELWEDERSHRNALGLNPSPEMPLDPSESSRKSGGEWISEARWWDEIRQRIQRGRSVPEPANHADNQSDWDPFVMTTFESVEAIWDKKYKTWKPPKKENGTQEQDGKVPEARQPPEYSLESQNDFDSDGQIEVDMSLLSDQEIVRLDQEEKQRWNEETWRSHAGVEDEDEDEDDNTLEDLPPDSPKTVTEDIEL